MSKYKLKDFAFSLKGHTQRLPCHSPRVGPHRSLERPPARMNIGWIALLVAAEDREVFRVPLIATRVRIVRCIVPEGAIHERILQRAKTPVQRLDLFPEVSSAICLLVI